MENLLSTSLSVLTAAIKFALDTFLKLNFLGFYAAAKYKLKKNKVAEKQKDKNERNCY